MLLNSIFKHVHNQNTMTFAFVLEKRLANHNRSYLHIEDLKLPQQQQKNNNNNNNNVFQPKKNSDIHFLASR